MSIILVTNPSECEKFEIEFHFEPPSSTLNYCDCRFIMNEPFIEPTGPSLGALTVYMRSNERDSVGNLVMKPMWRLYNHQGPDWIYAQVPINNLNDSVRSPFDLILISGSTNA